MHAQDRNDLVQKAAEKARELMNKDPEPVLTPEQEKAIDEVVKKAKMELA